MVVRAPAVAANGTMKAPIPDGWRPRQTSIWWSSGTLLRSGLQLRMTAQLIEASSGTVMGATAVKGSMDDIFALEDELTESRDGTVVAGH